MEDSRLSQERAAFGMKAPDGAFNANPGAPTSSSNPSVKNSDKTTSAAPASS